MADSLGTTWETLVLCNYLPRYLWIVVCGINLRGWLASQVVGRSYHGPLCGEIGPGFALGLCVLITVAQGVQCASLMYEWGTVVHHYCMNDVHLHIIPQSENWVSSLYFGINYLFWTLTVCLWMCDANQVIFSGSGLMAHLKSLIDATDWSHSEMDKHPCHSAVMSQGGYFCQPLWTLTLARLTVFQPSKPWDCLERTKLHL